ncbi:MAG: NAD(P)H-binding protein [Anaerolineae bacterium]|nr:NAD(P)H-binding protein [Anaerolineae bacterium]
MTVTLNLKNDLDIGNMLLVTGATGFVGRAVVRRAVAESRAVRCLLRPSRREQSLPPGTALSAVSASLDDLPALRTAVGGATAILHLAGEEDLWNGGLREDHIAGTANLITVAQELDVQRLVYLSHLGADTASAYPLFRILGEAESLVSTSGLDYTIVQTSLVYGAEDVFTNMLVMLAKCCPWVMPIPDAGLCRFQPLWVEDLARCLLATVDSSSLSGRTIQLGGPEHFTFPQLVSEVLRAAGMRRRLLNVRIPFMQWIIALLDTFLPRTPTPFWWLDLLAVNGATDLMAVPRLFDFEPCRLTNCLDYLSRPRAWRRTLVRYITSRG